MNLPALPLSPDRYPWMSDDGMSMLPDQKVMSLLADGLQEKMSFKPFMDFLGSIPKSSAAPKIAREWFAGSGLVEESEDEGRSIRPLVDMLSNENLFAGFQKILRKMPDADDMDAAMRESEIHNLSMTIAKTLLPEMHRAFEEIEAGERNEEGVSAPSRPSAPAR
ncbi:hypothetical protein, partial [Roseibium sp.]